ncbi:hypothetical protein [Pseudomonas sp. SORT22]|uniref:hypothetical protein n=1 Tax=Pseudomonas sp. SORT22 TaxID=2813842 RepID=UPI00201B7A57|nr:hypothetical protein [Pseudomonas sp. SORT22]
MKSIAVAVAMLLSLTGCVGATVVLPHKDTYPTAAHRILRLKNITPKVSKSEKSDVTPRMVRRHPLGCGRAGAFATAGVQDLQ